MRTGFKFRGRHSSEFGLTMLTKSRPILPAKRSNLIDLPGRDGSFDYAAMNDYGRAMYQNRSFSMSLHIPGINIFDLQRKISDVAVWLGGGQGDLIFDDMPAVTWTAEIKNDIDFVPELEGKKAIITVEFDVFPFSSADFSAAVGPVLGSAVPLGASIPLGGAPLTFTVEAVKGGQYELDFINLGTAPVRPIVTVKPSEGCMVGAFTMALDGSEFSYEAEFGPNGAVVIDFDEYTARIEGSDRDFSGGCNGCFWELAPGQNKVIFAPVTMYSSDGTEAEAQSYSIQCDYVPKYVYNMR